MMQPAVMVLVQVRHDHPAHVLRRKATRPHLRADLLFRRDVEDGRPLDERHEGREVARPVGIRRNAGIDDDQPLGVFDHPHMDRQPVGHRLVEPRVQKAAHSVALALPPAFGDADAACLDGMNFHEFPPIGLV
jgi:hypothetical protein